MAKTPGGLPYPVGTDKVVDGDDAIKALALGVDPAHREATGPVNYPVSGNTLQGLGTQTLDATATIGAAVVTVSNETWTVAVAGVYSISATVVMTGTVVGRFLVDIRKIGLTNAIARGVASNESVCSASVVQRLAVGDTFTIQMFSAQTGAIGESRTRVTLLQRVAP